MATRWLRSRFVSLVLVVWAVTFVTFMLANLLPGDPVLALLGEDATPANITLWHHKLGLDRPMAVRYVDWLANAAHGDFGASYRTGESVFGMIVQRLPVTIEIIVLTQIVALAVAVPSGIVAAWRSGRGFDRATMVGSLGLLSMPPFLIGILLIYLFSIRLGWMPATGFVSLGDDVLENLQSVALPVVALALAEIPVYLRLLRGDMIRTLQQDFIAVARAKGMPTRRILLSHALRPSSFSLITVIGVNIGRLIGGTIIIEVLFALPGIGQLLIQSVYQQDYMVLQGIVLFVSVAFVLINAAVDGLYRMLDPRTSHG
jgi:peptide/nickel transport system permease protein